MSAFSFSQISFGASRIQPTIPFLNSFSFFRRPIPYILCLMTISQPMIPISTPSKCNTSLAQVLCLVYFSLTNTRFPKYVLHACGVTAIVLANTCSDHVGVLDLVGICCYPTPTLHAATNRRGGNNHHTLSLCPGGISGPV